LSLDGGGVRGLSSLIILEDLIEGVAKHEKMLCIRAQDDITLPRPCDYFYLIGGTSTGGIIAILLARLRLGVSNPVYLGFKSFFLALSILKYK
jgi:patatin-like phospholipase/acyl hydrolase